jgi:hypothetical protein
MKLFCFYLIIESDGETIDEYGEQNHQQIIS